MPCTVCTACSIEDQEKWTFVFYLHLKEINRNLAFRFSFAENNRSCQFSLVLFPFAETWRNGNMEKWIHGDMDTWRHRDMMDMETWRGSNTKRKRRWWFPFTSLLFSQQSEMKRKKQSENTRKEIFWSEPKLNIRKRNKKYKSKIKRKNTRVKTKRKEQFAKRK